MHSPVQLQPHAFKFKLHSETYSICMLLAAAWGPGVRAPAAVQLWLLCDVNNSFIYHYRAVQFIDLTLDCQGTQPGARCLNELGDDGTLLCLPGFSCSPTGQVLVNGAPCSGVPCPPTESLPVPNIWSICMPLQETFEPPPPPQSLVL